MRITLEQLEEVKAELFDKANQGEKINAVFLSDDELGLAKVKLNTGFNQSLSIELTTRGQNNPSIYSEARFKQKITQR